VKNPVTVLLVDDDVDFLAQTRLALEAEGFRVVSAGTRREAEELLDRQPPDVAVVDLMLEQSDSGFTLCYHIKKRHPEVPVILVTAVTGETGLDFEPADEDEQSWVKADVYLAKPVRSEQLVRDIRRLLKGTP
jgi:two-component system, OmpR family, response regulator